MTVNAQAATSTLFVDGTTGNSTRLATWSASLATPVQVCVYPDWVEMIQTRPSVVLPPVVPRDVRIRLRWSNANASFGLYDTSGGFGAIPPRPPDMGLPANGFVWRGVATHVHVDVALQNGGSVILVTAIAVDSASPQPRARQYAQPSFAASLPCWFPPGATRMRFLEQPAVGAFVYFFDPSQVQANLVTNLYSMPAAAMADWVPIDSRAAAWLQDGASIVAGTKLIAEFE